MAATDIAQEISRLTTAKADLKTAIEGKGVTVPSTTKLDGYASLVDQIQQGGAEEAPENDVCFYDYDGKRIASFTIAEAKALTQAQYNAILPPAHEGLTFQEWNWSLSDIQSYNRRFIDIGANYEPTDGKCHIKVHIPYDGFEYVQGTGRVGEMLATTFDWGDGNTEQYSGSSTTHTYAQAGDYDITIYPNSPTDVNYLQINFLTTAAAVPSLGCVREINLAHYTQQSAIMGISCPVSFPASAITVNGYANDYVPIIVIPKLAIFANALGILWQNGFSGMVSFPKTITSPKFNNYFNQALFKRFVIPEYTDAFSFTYMNTWYNCEVISLPSSLNITGGNILQNFTKLRIIDIPQGFVPTSGVNLSGSNYILPPDLVDFLTKLGTTSTTITITLGTANLNKLTEAQKQIATNKGYTLA